MTQEFHQMLQLAAMGATGHSIEMEQTDIEWEKVVEAARQQKVDCYVACALKKHKQLPCPAEIRERLIREARSLLFSNALHRSAVIRLLEKMEAEGIHAVLLKGYAISECYALPESRTCGDVDIWIHPKDEARACAFMKKEGFAVDPRRENGHHAVCHHPVLGYVELHVILYDEIVEDIWFGKMDGTEYIREPHRAVDTQDGRYFTLGYTDHFVFLVLHMIKHFILSGLTAQMLFDTALYFKNYADKMDVDRVWNTISSLHYDKLFQCILWAMIRYCGFCAEDFPGICAKMPELAENVMTDLEEGGWMGYADKQAREEGWHEYNRSLLVRDKSKAGYWRYMLKWKLGQIKYALFPGRNTLEKQYPVLKKWPLLMPAVWVYRLFARGIRSVRKGLLTSYLVVNEAKINDTAQKRVALFRKLDMM